MMYLLAVQSSLLSLQSQRKQASLASSVFSANRLLLSACSAKKPVFSEIAEKTGFICNLRGTIPGPPGACVEMRRTRFYRPGAFYRRYTDRYVLQAFDASGTFYRRMTDPVNLKGV
jgi:hypothetical protein